MLRAWAKYPNLQNSKHCFERNCQFPRIFGSPSRLLEKDDDAPSDVITRNTTQQDSNSIEIVFEIDDTGMGIPKEKRASISKNYVQIKESSTGEYEGTSLGLGIVQSFVSTINSFTLYFILTFLQLS